MIKIIPAVAISKAGMIEAIINLKLSKGSSFAKAISCEILLINGIDCIKA